MLTIWTYDWVPNGPRGFVRDLRLRWACEEAGLSYDVRSVSFRDRGPEHLARQPFGQIPFLEDDGITLFESGACLLHLANKSDKLMPQDRKGAAEALEWTIAALNSIEMVSVPWWFIGVGGVKPEDNPLSQWLNSRFKHLEAVLAQRPWLAGGRFSVADIIMADVTRQTYGGKTPDRYPQLKAYVERACARPAFKKAYQDQLAHFAAGDEAKSAS